MRRISFAKTTDSIRNRSKTVTRRRPGTWKNLRPGQLLLCVDKLRGLKKGQSSEKLAVIRVVAVDVEPLKAITTEDLQREAVPGIETTEDFVRMYCEMNNELPDCETRRIEFEYAHWPGSQRWESILLKAEEGEQDLQLMDGIDADELLVQETTTALREYLKKARKKNHDGWNRPQLVTKNRLVHVLTVAVENSEWLSAVAIAAALELRSKRGLDVCDDHQE